MNYEVTKEGLVVRLEGRVSSANATAFEEELLSLAAEHPDLVVELDATGLEYISSAGLRVLLATKKELGNGEVRVRNVPPTIKDILNVTRLAQFVVIE